MTQLFGHRWVSQEGDPLEAGKFSGRFLLWCRKTEKLSDADWARGFDVVEYRVAEAATGGKQAWPPSYAEFIGFCQKPVGVAAHKLFERPALEDKTAKEKRLAVGKVKARELLKIFD